MPKTSPGLVLFPAVVLTGLTTDSASCPDCSVSDTLPALHPPGHYSGRGGYLSPEVFIPDGYSVKNSFLIIWENVYKNVCMEISYIHIFPQY